MEAPQRQRSLIQIASRSAQPTRVFGVARNFVYSEFAQKTVQLFIHKLPNIQGVCLAFRQRHSAKIHSTPARNFEVWLYENGHNVTGSRHVAEEASERPIHIPLRTLFGCCLPEDFLSSANLSRHPSIHPAAMLLPNRKSLATVSAV